MGVFASGLDSHATIILLLFQTFLEVPLMSPVLSLILLTTLLGVGGLLAALFKGASSKAEGPLVAFTAGAMLAVASLHLVPEALENASRPLTAILLLVAGFAVTYLLNCWIDKDEHHSDHDHPHQCACGHHDLRTASLELAAAVALHNMPVGMAVGAAAASHGMGETVIFTALTICLHNLPEGASIAAPLLSDGTRPVKAVGLAALSGLPTVLGALLGYFLGSAAPALLTVSLALAAGAMLYVIFFELIPEALAGKKTPAVFLMLAGLAISALILHLAGHHH